MAVAERFGGRTSSLMNRRSHLVPLLCVAFGFACSSHHHDVVVRHHPTPGVSLSTYPKYHLVVAPSEEAGPTHWLVEKAIHDDLRAKGYQPVDRMSADLIVTYETDVEEKSKADMSQAPDGAMAARKSTEKHIAIVMHDAKQDRPVWQGTASGEVHPTRLTASLEQALVDILAGVPPTR